MVPWGVEKYLRCAFSNCATNIMLDELWIGKYNFSPTKDIFIGAGGESYHYVPALNDDKAHIKLMLDLVHR